MAAYLSPIGNAQQLDANGAPLSGGFIYTYQAGTTSPVATYTDSSGAVAQANPIVLNSLGLPSSPIWLPVGLAVKLVIQNSAGVTQRTVDNITGINDPTGSSAVDEWIVFTGSPTFVSATSFSVGGDKTLTFQAGRRVKSTNTGGKVYSTVTASTYNSGTGLTTITVANDSGTLDAGLSQVSYGLLSFTNPSVPGKQSLVANGHKDFPDGFIQQWGNVVLSTSPQTITFPTPFLTQCFGVMATQANATSPASYDAAVLSTTQFALRGPLGTAVSWWAFGK